MKKIILITILILNLTISVVLADGPPPIQTPEAGAGGSAMPFLGESFQTDLATGAATLSVPITVPPGRKNMQPNIGLSYSSNNANGICGVGWDLTAGAVQRSTKNGAPKYNGTDTFTFGGGGSNAELVNIGGNEYRAKIESGFMRYTFSGNVWTVYDKSGTKYTFGSSDDSKVTNNDNTKTFAWYLKEVEDVYGNYIKYTYGKETNQIYLERIEYTGSAINPSLTPNKTIEFRYDEYGKRTDRLTSYRTGWQIITDRILTSIRVYLDGNPVWTYKLLYGTSENTNRSLLESITVYERDGGAGCAFLPPKRFEYQKLER